MSGGYWEYADRNLESILLNIAEDATVQKRWPEIGQVFAALVPLLLKSSHEMDWDLSGDLSITNDHEFSESTIGEILEAVMKVAPDAWFPRGKWATIQAIRGRIYETGLSSNKEMV